jgi:hypothetical protein
MKYAKHALPCAHFRDEEVEVKMEEKMDSGSHCKVEVDLDFWYKSCLKNTYL